MSAPTLHRMEGNKWNGRRRYPHEKFEPFCVLHSTESASAGSTARYFANLTKTNPTRLAQNQKARYAGYHHVFDLTEAYNYGSPKTLRAYGAVAGGNDGFHLSGAYFVRDWAKSDTDLWLARFVSELEDCEEEHGFRIDRIYSGDYGKGEAYKQDRASNTRKGFYFHSDIQPRNRSDPGWKPQHVEQFLSMLLLEDEPEPPVAADNPTSGLLTEFQQAIRAGVTDGSRPSEPATRVEAAVMAMRASKLKETA